MEKIGDARTRAGKTQSALYKNNVIKRIK